MFIFLHIITDLLDRTRTVCEGSSQIVSKEVCVYPYHQKTVRLLFSLLILFNISLIKVTAVAQTTEIGFKNHVKRMEVSRCHSYIEKGKDGEKEVEKCTSEYVEREYKIPTVQEGFEDFIELNVPQPQRDCRVIKIDIPEVNCRVSLFPRYSQYRFYDNFLARI